MSRSHKCWIYIVNDLWKLCLPFQAPNYILTTDSLTIGRDIYHLTSVSRKELSGMTMRFMRWNYLMNHVSVSLGKLVAIKHRRYLISFGWSLTSKIFGMMLLYLKWGSNKLDAYNFYLRLWCPSSSLKMWDVSYRLLLLPDIYSPAQDLNYRLVQWSLVPWHVTMPASLLSPHLTMLSLLSSSSSRI